MLQRVLKAIANATIYRGLDDRIWHANQYTHICTTIDRLPLETAKELARRAVLENAMFRRSALDIAIDDPVHLAQLPLSFREFVDEFGKLEVDLRYVFDPAAFRVIFTVDDAKDIGARNIVLLATTDEGHRLVHDTSRPEYALEFLVEDCEGPECESSEFRDADFAHPSLYHWVVSMAARSEFPGYGTLNWKHRVESLASEFGIQ